MRVTDRRTDRILLAIPRLHYMQRGKNFTKPTVNCRKINSIIIVPKLATSGVVEKIRLTTV